jgi:hypothetical protein
VTPRERVEAVARAAWGVSRVDVTVVTLPEHAVAVVSSERTTDSVPRSQTATAPTVDAALLRAADLIAGGVSSSATRATRDADAAAAEARILARLAACVACAVPCRDHVARCKGAAPCREVMPRVALAPWTDRMKRITDMLALGKASPLLPHGWVPAVWRPLWWRRGRKGRACRDPRKHAPTCKVLS